MARFRVTGSSGHLGEALVRTLRDAGHEVVGLDVLPSPWTTVVGSVTDRALLRRATDGVTHVLHTATLHKPHVGSHPRQAFVDVNVTGTLAVLECAADAGAASVVLTSSTSAFGRALRPPPGSPAVWVTEDVAPAVRNVYGATKVAAEDLCELAAADGLPVVVLRTSRFFPEAPDPGPGLRQRPGPHRSRLAPAHRRRDGRRPDPHHRRPPHPPGPRRGREGLPPRAHRGVHTLMSQGGRPPGPSVGGWTRPGDAIG